MNAGCPNLDNFDTITSIQDEDDKLLEQKIGLENVRSCGD